MQSWEASSACFKIGNAPCLKKADNIIVQWIKRWKLNWMYYYLPH